MMRGSLISFFILNVTVSFSQVVFAPDRFTEIVLKHHPLSKQATLQPSFGQAAVLKARGDFDPKVYNDLNQKNFNATQYYNLLNAGLKIPTWYGIEVKTGFESNRGKYVDMQEQTPSSGLWYGGISVSLGQGLFIDQRRAELFKAKLFRQSTLFEQKLQLNELLYDANYSYWNWFLAFHSYGVLQDAYELVDTRYEAVKRTAELGDRPAIDSVEVRIQLQNRLSLLRNAETDLQNTRYRIAAYLWDENAAPLELDSVTKPLEINDVQPVIFSALKQDEIDSIVENHPYLQVTNFKIQQLEIDQRLKRELLKPSLNLQYNLINEPIQYNPIAALSPNNYKWGLNFEMPLFLRKERGDLALAKLKVQDEKLNFQNSRAYIQFKIQSAYVEFTNALAQIDIYENTVTDTKRLVEAEQQMFDAGESSLFLLNAREMSYIQARLKLVECIAKSQQAYVSLLYSLAALF